MSINTITSITTRGVYMSRYAMLKWVNNLLKGQFTKIEDLRSGVAYCRMMYMIYPDSINMKRVKIAPRLEHEYVHNLRLLQTVFNRLAIEKLVPIESLIQGRFKHNFEFMQWFIKFYDSVVPSQNQKPKIKPSKTVSVLAKSKISMKKPKHALAKTPVTKRSKTQVATKKEEPIPEPQVNEIKEESMPVKQWVWDPIANGPMSPCFNEIIRVRDAAYQKLFVIEQMLATVNDESPMAGLTKRINAILSAPMDGKPPTENINDYLHEVFIDT